MNWFKKLLAILIIPQFIIVKWLKVNPEIVEKYYSNGLYPIIFELNSFFYSKVSFSVGDLIYLTLFLSILFQITKFVKNRKFIGYKNFINIGFYSSIIYFFFHINWGLNYYRIPLNKKFDYEENYSDQELFRLTNKLLLKANVLHKKLTDNKNESVKNNYSNNKLFLKINSNFTKIVNKKIEISKIKNSILSKPLSYMGFSGYLNPLTLESQINDNLPQINKSATIAHEMSHQFGYALEDESNFLAFINTYNNDDDYISYCSYLFAFRYFYSELKLKDVKKSKLIFKKIIPGILINFNESNEFWKSHQNIFEPIFKTSYDKFLKVNGQKNGIKSYNMMVSLILAYDKTNPI